jgi:hypothetical protein
LDVDFDPVRLDQASAHFSQFSGNLLPAPRRAERALWGGVLREVAVGFALDLALKGQ